MKKEKFYELIHAVQKASTGAKKISTEIQDHLHLLYESFKEEVDENIKSTGYNDLTYVYLSGLFFELSEHKRKTPGFMGIFTMNSENTPVQPINETEHKKNTNVAKYGQSCYCSNRNSDQSPYNYMQDRSALPITQAISGTFR